MQLGRMPDGLFTDGKTNATTTTLNLNTIYTYKADYSNGKSYINGVEADSRNLSSSGNAYLFASNNSDSEIFKSYFIQCRTFSCKLTA